MICSPVEIVVSFNDTKRERTIKGVLLEKADLRNVIKLIDKCNANGLKGKDAICLMSLKDALGDLTDKRPKKESKKPTKQSSAKKSDCKGSKGKKK